MKRCARCKETKALDQFNLSSRSLDGHHAYCRDCHRAHYQANKVRHKQNVRRNERARRERYREYLAGVLASGCVDCGVKDIRVLQFDHVRGDKMFSISQMNKDSSFAKLAAEVAKCDVRCGNCHAIVTFERRGGSWRDRYFAPEDRYHGNMSPPEPLAQAEAVRVGEAE